MASSPDLDDLKQTVVYIPYNASEDTEDEHNAELEQSSFHERDFPDGHEMRLKAYRDAWNKCLKRVQSVVHALHTPLAEEITQNITNAYMDPLPGLPYAEIPAFAISAPSSGSSFISNIATRLEGHETHNQNDEDEDTPNPSSYVAHLRPSDAPNIMSAMKALIGAFVDKPPKGQNVKRKPTTSLAQFDIELLKAWYDAVQSNHDPEDPGALSSKLVVFMHEFEQFPPPVVQDMFHICSSHVPTLPIVFVLGLSSPPSPSYIHSSYPRATLSLLQLQTFSLPEGVDVFNKIVTETFFDLDFEPDVMLGAAALEYLVDFFTRHTISLDGVSTMLQLAYLKHFEEPLTVLGHDPASLTNTLTDPASFTFVDSLLSRCISTQTTAKRRGGWPVSDITELLSAVVDARTNFHIRLRDLKVALGALLCVQRVLFDMGHRTSEDNRTVFEIRSAALRGNLGREATYIGKMVTKMSAEKLRTLLEELNRFVELVPVPCKEQEAAITLDEQVTEIRRSMEKGKSDTSMLTGQLGRWLTQYFDDHIINLEDLSLWDIWYTGSTPFPSELINPSPRASVLSALLDPYGFFEDAGNRRRRAIWELPDTSILFRRYLEAGRMVNVYDWYESFAMVLDNQRKRKRRQAEDVPAEGDDDEETQEKWKLHVHSRFIRALHELDFLGFVKHTGRKADHIMRTVYESAE
ncbi:origin recognition complex subunit 3 N-terminus-domain-containing protein [Amylostereum chailletii]|nr:origin recognition complex subunit 3 N-terminus-domain-containing protein [Amylostereum chailletii]